MAIADRLRHWAASAPATVFVARGGGADLLPVEVAADLRVRLVPTPRHATVLLAAGRFGGPMGVALDRVHDQMGSPSRTLWWTADPNVGCPVALSGAAVMTGLDPVEAILAAHHLAVVEGGRDADALPDAPPNRFEGRGDTGHGGEGMMGGVPWGRPMAMTGADRDGLQLDEHEIAWGPFLVGLPTGVQVRTRLQGGLVQAAEVSVLDLGEGPVLGDGPDVDGARRHLQWLAEVLRLVGLDALAARAARLARATCTVTQGDPILGRELAGLVRRVRRSGLPASWDGLAPVDGCDARQRLELGLESVLAGPGGSAGPGPAVSWGDRTLADVGALLVGLTWTDAVAALASLHLRPDAHAPLATVAP